MTGATTALTQLRDDEPLRADGGQRQGPDSGANQDRWHERDHRRVRADGRAAEAIAIRVTSCEEISESTQEVRIRGR